MKKAEIILNGKYANNAGTVREVIAVGTEYPYYRGQENTDCLRYRVLEKGRPFSGLLESNCTRQAFASWAKVKV